MLQLIDIKKDYKTVGQEVHALKGVNLRFRRNEFVSVLGASGCGKTTLLNIIGGLDHYTSGDLIINGKSTKTYKDHDWDVYRNHRIGFVFQSYNLIPQQTVLGNVEIALTIAGASKAERRLRAEEALRKVGLEKEMKKRPNQLSGGQMQRVAIARALVNNPEILLADEPTGALDTETSVQIMDLIREIAGERLVIMVTHNPELAEEYSSRIVRLQDGLVLSDSNPYDGTEEEEDSKYEAPMYKTSEAKAEKAPAKSGKKKERSSMSFKTSLGLSARNLAMKRGRTIVTSIAGSIGIISVCLVLALSNGFNRYIAKTQEDMLSSNPLQITETTVDMTAIMSGMSTASQMPDLSELENSVYVNSFLTNIAQGMTVQNNLSQEYQDYVRAMDGNIYEAITMDTGLEMRDSLYTEVLVGEGEGTPTVMSLTQLKAHYVAKIAAIDGSYSQLVPLVDYLGKIYGKMPGTSAKDAESGEFGEYVLSQYDVIEGRFPDKDAALREAVLVVGDNNDLTDLTLAQLGFMREDDFVKLFESDESKTPEQTIDFSKIIGKKYRVNYNDSIYLPAPEGSEYAYTKASGTRASLEEGEGRTVTVTGILRVKEGMSYGCLGDSGLFFTEQLNDDLLAVNYESKISKTLREQEAKTKEFLAVMQAMSALDATDPAIAETYQALNAQMMAILGNPDNQKLFTAKVEKSFDAAYMSGETWAKEMPMLASYYFISDTSALRAVGAIDTVNAISVYTGSFENKEAVVAYLDAWNDIHAEDTENQVKYTDTVGLMMAMVETMLNAITSVLVAFTGISLVVSSVMIGIITYVSVVERVKEIGVLRSLGARKSDIKNLFNAETFIIGLSSGLFGVAVTYLLSLAINALLGAATGLTTLAALPISSAAIMVVVSVVLTLISGLIPANAAAKKDPVVALRTE